MMSLMGHQEFGEARPDGGLLYVDTEGTAGNMLVSPLNNQDIVSSFFHDVAYGVLVSADVLHVDLFAWCIRSQYSHHQHVQA